MAWLYLPFMESNFSPESACSGKDFEQLLTTWAAAIAVSATLNGKLSPQASWRRACKKALWMKRLSGLTLPPSTAENGVEKWIASLPDSHARTCLLQGVEMDWTARAPDCSSRSHGSPTIAVRGSSFWRTSQASLLPPPPLWTRKKANSKNAPLPESWENWPTAGGMRSGSLFQRPMWAPVTAGHDGSASRGETWLTPNVPNGGRSVSAELVASKGTTETGEKRTVGLESQTRHWATPQAHDAVGGKTPDQVSRMRAAGHGVKNLNEEACQWPTPAAQQYGGTAEQHLARKAKMDGGARTTVTELNAFVGAWPTPATRDHKGANSSQHINRTDGRSRNHADQLPNFVAHFFLPQDQTMKDGQESLQKTELSPRRLNPIFGELLMGWRLQWTSPELHACGASETELFRSKLRSQLSNFFGDPAS